MIDAKDATNKAVDYFTDLYGTSEGIILEEVELSEDEKNWLITLSFPNPEGRQGLFHPPRKYKLFRISAQTGEVKSMKIRVIK